MVTFDGHLLPVLAVLLGWFASTGAIVWLVHRGRGTYAHAMLWTSAAAVAGVALIAATRHDPSVAGAYSSAAGALLIWAWQEFAFLTGAAAGPRRIPADPGARGLARFRQAAAALLWHELALALSLALLAILSWGAANPVGVTLFALLFVLRLAAKLSIFSGVPNFSDELLPSHLHYLRSYFGPARISLTLVAMLAGSLALAFMLADRALAAPTAAAATGSSLLFALAALGALELTFLALPVRDGALWRWAIRTGAATRIAGQA